jgi:DNA-binding MarR family transcriptional regulator
MITWTPAQKPLLDALKRWPPEDPPPTRKELGERMGKTTAAVASMLERMERRGLVRLHRGWRGIEVLENPRQIEAV